MAGRGDFQKQLAALVAAAEANNMKLEDILPDPMRDHLMGINELHAARDYIKELEEREKELKTTNENITKDLHEKHVKFENLPMEYHSMKVDLQQAQRQVIFYKDTTEDLQMRVQRYRQQLNDLVDKQQANTSNIEKIEDLAIRIKDQQAIISKLMDDNNQSEEMYKRLRELDAKALERKREQLAKKEKELIEKDELLVELQQKAQEAKEYTDFVLDDTDPLTFEDSSDTETLVDVLEADPVMIMEQNIDLLQQNLSLSEQNQALEDRHLAMRSQISGLIASQESAASKDFKAQILAAAVSEIKTLNHYYRASFSVLDAFSKVFYSPKGGIPPFDYITDQLDEAQEALSGYHIVKAVVRATIDGAGTDDLEQVALCKELDSLAASAADSMSCFEILNNGFLGFLNQLSDDPKMLSEMNAALCDAGRGQVINIYNFD